MESEDLSSRFGSATFRLYKDIQVSFSLSLSLSLGPSEGYYEELAYVIMEAEKSHDFPTASWRHRNQERGSSLRQWPNPGKPMIREQRMRWPRSDREAAKWGWGRLRVFLPSFPFCSIWVLDTWDDAHSHQGKSLLIHLFKC
jgi:hypothetical protein